MLTRRKKCGILTHNDYDKEGHGRNPAESARQVKVRGRVIRGLSLLSRQVEFSVGLPVRRVKANACQSMSGTFCAI